MKITKGLRLAVLLAGLTYLSLLIISAGRIISQRPDFYSRDTRVSCLLIEAVVLALLTALGHFYKAVYFSIAILLVNTGLVLIPPNEKSILYFLVFSVSNLLIQLPAAGQRAKITA